MARIMAGPRQNEVALILEQAEMYILRDLLDDTIAIAEQNKKQRRAWCLKKPILQQICRVLYQSPRRPEDKTPPPLEKPESWML